MVNYIYILAYIKEAKESLEHAKRFHPQEVVRSESEVIKFVCATFQKEKRRKKLVTHLVSHSYLQYTHKKKLLNQ